MSAINLAYNPAVPARQNFIVSAGEDATLTVSLAPQGSIVGQTFALNVKQNSGDATSLFSKTATLTDTANGVLTFTLARADTLALTPGPLYYEIRRIDGGANTLGALGQVNLLPGS